MPWRIITMSHLAHEGKKVSELRASYPAYFMAKNRVDLTPETDVDEMCIRDSAMSLPISRLLLYHDCFCRRVAYGILPVSYTHLDVYKRQMYNIGR